MRPRTIILVDDDSDDRFFLQQALEICNVSEQVIEAESVYALIDLLSKGDLDVALIIIDMNMPMMNGLDAIPHIRALQGDKPLPVVMISTSPSNELEKNAYAAGVASFMAKPNSLDEFTTLAELVRARFLI